MKLSDQVAVIAGGANGIGAETAQREQKNECSTNVTPHLDLICVSLSANPLALNEWRNWLESEFLLTDSDVSINSTCAAGEQFVSGVHS